MFRPLHRLKVGGLAAGPNVADVVDFVVLGYFPMVGPVYKAVEHLHHPLAFVATTPRLPEVAVGVMEVRDTDEAPGIEPDENHGPRLVSHLMGLVP